MLTMQRIGPIHVGLPAICCAAMAAGFVKNGRASLLIRLYFPQYSVTAAIRASTGLIPCCGYSATQSTQCCFIDTAGPVLVVDKL
jgi:hypothetical protein